MKKWHISFSFFSARIWWHTTWPQHVRYPSWRTLAAGKCCEINEIESSVPVSVIICDLPSCHRQILQISQILCLCRGGAHNDWIFGTLWLPLNQFLRPEPFFKCGSSLSFLQLVEFSQFLVNDQHFNLEWFDLQTSLFCWIVLAAIVCLKLVSFGQFYGGLDWVEFSVFYNKCTNVLNENLYLKCFR